MIRKYFPALIAGLFAAALGSSAIAADKPADSTSSGTRGTVKGGTDYENTMKQAGMSGMSGMSGDRSMTAKPAEKKAMKKKAKKKAMMKTM